LCGTGVISKIHLISIPAAIIQRTACSLPTPIHFRNTSALAIEWRVFALFTAFSVAT
jgi:hypothetical protein